MDERNAIKWFKDNLHSKNDYVPGNVFRNVVLRCIDYK